MFSYESLKKRLNQKNPLINEIQEHSKTIMTIMQFPTSKARQRYLKTLGKQTVNRTVSKIIQGLSKKKEISVDVSFYMEGELLEKTDSEN
jgi:2-phosphoglycerate kinase